MAYILLRPQAEFLIQQPQIHVMYGPQDATGYVPGMNGS